MKRTIIYPLGVHALQVVVCTNLYHKWLNHLLLQSLSMNMKYSSYHSCQLTQKWMYIIMKLLLIFFKMYMSIMAIVISTENSTDCIKKEKTLRMSF